MQDVAENVIKLLRRTILQIENAAREDPGTVFRSKAGYNWTCPMCGKKILEGQLAVAYQPRPTARTTYVHLECDTWERNYESHEEGMD